MKKKKNEIKEIFLNQPLCSTIVYSYDLKKLEINIIELYLCNEHM